MAAGDDAAKDTGEIAADAAPAQGGDPAALAGAHVAVGESEREYWEELGATACGDGNAPISVLQVNFGTTQNRASPDTASFIPPDGFPKAASPLQARA